MSHEQPLQLKHILPPQLTYCHLKGSSKKRLLQFMATEAGNSLDMNVDVIYQQLMDREKLGCTALGNGIAIPHCKLETLETPLAVLATLDEPINFDADDNQPVDLILVLLVPISENEQYKLALTQLAGQLMTPQYSQALRQANSAKALYQIAIHDNLS